MPTPRIRRRRTRVRKGDPMSDRERELMFRGQALQRWLWGLKGPLTDTERAKIHAEYDEVDAEYTRLRHARLGLPKV